jgi:hypothetical protein
VRTPPRPRPNAFGSASRPPRRAWPRPRADIGRWARTAYAGGESYLPGVGLATVLRGSTTDDLGAAVATLRRVGEHRGRVVDEFAAAEAERRDASDAAAAAAEAAETAAGEASRAHAAADAALQHQRQALAAGEAALARPRRPRPSPSAASSSWPVAAATPSPGRSVAAPAATSSTTRTA